MDSVPEDHVPLSEGRAAVSTVDLRAGLAVPEVEARLQLGLRLHETGQRILAFYLVEMTERRLHQESGHSSTAAYAEARLGIDRRRVAELVSVGRKLLTLPAVDRAFCEQRLGWAKLLHLVRVASPAHESAWLERALELTCRELAFEVRLSKPGSRPRDPKDRKGLPEVRFPLACSLSALTHQKVDLAKRKLTAELGRPVDDAEYLDVVSELFLNLEEDGSVKGRTHVSASLYRIVLRPDGELSNSPHLLMDSEDGPIPVKGGDLVCDAETESSKSTGRDAKTPARLRKQVLDRDGQRCRCCRSRWRLMVHHIRFLSHGGRTQAWNLITLCAGCHGLVHEGLLVLAGERAENIGFEDKCGKPVHDAGTGPSVHLALRDALPDALPDALLVTLQPQAVPREVVTLSTIPEIVDGTWWRRHSHLIRFRSGKGLAFMAGQPSADDETIEFPKNGVRIDGEALNGDAFNGDAFNGDAFNGDAFKRVIGQDALVGRLRNAARGSRMRGGCFPHTLFVGPAGTGKTTLARGVAAAFGTRLLATSGPLLEDTHMLLRLLASLKQGDMLFLDEIHAVPRSVLEVLYEAMASGRVDLTLHAGARARAVRLDLPAFTLIAATTEEGDLPTALRSRFGRRETLGFYAQRDLAVIAQARAAKEDVELPPEAATMLASHARGTPREVLRLLECVLDETAFDETGLDETGLDETAFDETGLDEEALDETALDETAVQRALERLGYDEEGLDPSEQRYVAALRESNTPIPLGRLARVLGASARTLAEHLEPYLFRRGLVRMTARGREAVAP